MKTSKHRIKAPTILQKYRGLCYEFGIKPFPNSSDGIADTLLQHISHSTNFMENLTELYKEETHK